MHILFLLYEPYFSLGTVGNIILLMLVLVLTFLTYKQRAWKGAAEAANNASLSAQIEMNIYKDANERLRTEKKELEGKMEQFSHDIRDLKTKTDLQPLFIIIKEWVSEGRGRFDESMQRLNQIHSEQTVALSAILRESETQRTTFTSAFTSISDTYKDHLFEDRKFQLDSQQMNLRFLNMMSDLEHRLSDMAVTIGKSKWSERLPEKYINNVTP